MSEDLNYFIQKLDEKMSKLWWLSLILMIIGIPIGFLISEHRLGFVISAIGLGILLSWFIINNKIETLQEKL